MFASGTGVQGEDEGQGSRNLAQHAEQRLQDFRMVDVGRAMHGHHAIALGRARDAPDRCRLP